MRAKVRERAEARRLRAEGMSLRAIAATVDASLASVSVWVRDVPSPAARRARTVKGPAIAPVAPPRRCARCELTLPASSFTRSKDGWQSWCRTCFREYFTQRGDAHRAHVRRNKAERLAGAREYLLEVLKTSRCADCGTVDTVVLEFDHRGDKTAAVSALIAEAAAVKRLKAEIDKCDVVCVNCHRRRTAQTYRWRRARADWRDAPAVHAPRERRNIDYLYSVLEKRGCSDCGEDDVVVLDFDHVGVKRGLLINLARGGASRKVLDAELTECVVRCGNCHRRRTVEQLGHYRSKSTAIMPPVGFEPTI